MTTRWPRILLATLCLLAFAASASAEGAWVLSSQLYTPSAGAWVLQTAYPTATECTEAIDYREVVRCSIRNRSVRERTPAARSR